MTAHDMPAPGVDGAVLAFRRTLADPAPPPGNGPALEALWWAGQGGGNRAHDCAQSGEGDMANAAYWYRRAGAPVPSTSLAAEWDAIAATLLARW